MELSTLRETVPTCTVSYDSAVEEPIECDILLPDYCPDILKILSCQAFPLPEAACSGGDTAAISGHVAVHILYLSQTAGLRSSTHKIPLSRTVELPVAAENPILSCQGTVDYLNCRAVSPRRVEVRGAMTVKLRVLSQQEETVTADTESEEMQLRREKTAVTRMVGFASRQYTLQEEVQIPDGLPGVRTVLFSHCTAGMTEYKAIANKIIAKGELKASFLYTGYEQDSTPEKVQFTLPISQILDVDGVDETCRCDVRMKAVSCELSPRSDENGEGRTALLEAVFSAQVKAYRQEEAPWVGDCYSTKHECSFTTRTLESLGPAELVSRDFDYTETLRLPGQVETVLDCQCQAWFSGLVRQEDKTLLTGKLRLWLLGQNREGEPVCYEQSRDITEAWEDSGGEHPVPDVELEAVDCLCHRAGEDSLDLRVKLHLAGTVSHLYRHEAADKITVEEEKPKEKSSAALTIYFADAGEDLWDISKRYNTSMEAVMAENTLPEPVIRQRQMLLIPIVS